MPVYEYTALDRAGKSLAGIVDADSAPAARQKLRGTGIFPVEIKESLVRPREQGARVVIVDKGVIETCGAAGASRWAAP